jgi:pimeloyl-ACP methyl ester carboxylesterase
MASAERDHPIARNPERQEAQMPAPTDPQAATSVAGVVPRPRTASEADRTAIRPFEIHLAEDSLGELRRRITATRWPTRELVDDRSQGVQLATMQALARYWATEYDLRRIEARLNALPQFATEIDGVDVHFIHVRSPHEDALPLIMTHGWPGSVIELLDSVGPLTDPPAYGGSAEDAFDLVLPSLPGYGFSGEPTELGWDLGRTARAWAELMHRLGYPRYVAQGGDVGAGVTDAMGRHAPEGLLGIHTNLLVPALNDPGALPADTEAERAALAAIKTFQTSGNGYFVEQATRPQTIGYALSDSPVALAAWMLDHDTDAYYKISRAFVDGQPSGNLTRDHVLDNVTTYWLTGTGASAARSYWEAYGPDAPAAAGQAPPQVSIPVGFTTFPGEIWRTPRSWAEQAYPTLTYFHEVDRGGHFAAWEEPELFASELRAAFRPLRG